MSGTRPDSGERGPRVGAALLLSHPLATPPRGESPPGLAPDEAHHSASAQRTLPDWLVQAPRAFPGGCWCKAVRVFLLRENHVASFKWGMQTWLLGLKDKPPGSRCRRGVSSPGKRRPG